MCWAQPKCGGIIDIKVDDKEKSSLVGPFSHKHIIPPVALSSYHTRPFSSTTESLRSFV